MNWRCSQSESRNRYLARFDAAEVDRYDAAVGTLGREDEDAYLSDLAPILPLRPGASLLDVGAGTGALCSVLSRLPGLSITALEPAPAMLVKLKRKAGLHGITAVEGFCDSLEDRGHFAAGHFDAIVSRQLVNGLYDPLAAFRNWHHWLSSHGTLVVIDGIYGRSAWTGVWQGEVDVLPLAACQGTAATPYLLETAGFCIGAVQWMQAVNGLPSTKTPRYVVVARRAVET